MLSQGHSGDKLESMAAFIMHTPAVPTKLTSSLLDNDGKMPALMRIHLLKLS